MHWFLHWLHTHTFFFIRSRLCLFLRSSFSYPALVVFLLFSYLALGVFFPSTHCECLILRWVFDHLFRFHGFGGSFSRHIEPTVSVYFLFEHETIHSHSHIKSRLKIEKERSTHAKIHPFIHWLHSHTDILLSCSLSFVSPPLALFCYPALVFFLILRYPALGVVFFQAPIASFLSCNGY